MTRGADHSGANGQAGGGQGEAGRPSAATPACVLHPNLRDGQAVEDPRSAEARLAEAVGLAEAIDLDVVLRQVVRVDRKRPASLFGSGQIERLAAEIEAAGAQVTVIDAQLTPVQQRNLERSLKCKVIDRTGLILEIFGERARTKEGQLQVELAHLSYQRSRLVRSWTHLERQRGGFGFLGGPGESQLEIDRRLITDRIARLRRELDQVKRTRELHRTARRKVPYPVVALVGYTNAGKSTLFNRMTAARVFAQDLLFATLDPTMRRLELPSGQTVILSDTVGFISDLPTDLVAAFRATLEEVLEADLILHVRDIAHPDSEAQRQSVLEVLGDLGVEPEAEGGQPVLEVLNKIDLLDADSRAVLQAQVARRDDQVCVSAVDGAGLDALLGAVERRLQAAYRTVLCSVDLSDGAAIAWLYRHGHVSARRDDADLAHMTVSLDPADLERFRRRHGAHSRIRRAGGR
ncbi:GTPase HflX [Phormidium willei BDU 130791]|nr:GTPase HflX [Phormidium willei BDU 130791]